MNEKQTQNTDSTPSREEVGCSVLLANLMELAERADERIKILKLELEDALNDLDVGDCVGWRNQASMREQMEIHDESLHDALSLLQDKIEAQTQPSKCEFCNETPLTQRERDHLQELLAEDNLS